MRAPGANRIGTSSGVQIVEATRRDDHGTTQRTPFLFVSRARRAAGFPARSLARHLRDAGSGGAALRHRVHREGSGSLRCVRHSAVQRAHARAHHPARHRASRRSCAQPVDSARRRHRRNRRRAPRTGAGGRRHPGPALSERAGRRSQRAGRADDGPRQAGGRARRPVDAREGLRRAGPVHAQPDRLARGVVDRKRATVPARGPAESHAADAGASFPRIQRDPGPGRAADQDRLGHARADPLRCVQRVPGGQRSQHPPQPLQRSLRPASEDRQHSPGERALPARPWNRASRCACSIPAPTRAISPRTRASARSWRFR